MASEVTEPKFPDIKVQLTGKDGNALQILGSVRQALLRGGATIEQTKEFITEATSGDYDHLLATAMKWVDVS